MSWKTYDFESRALIGEYPDEMAMSLAMRRAYAPGTRLVVENDDGGQYEGVVDTDVVKITLSPSLAEIDQTELHSDENYSPFSGRGNA